MRHFVGGKLKRPFFCLLICGAMACIGESPGKGDSSRSLVDRDIERLSRIGLPSGLAVPKGIVLVTIDTLRADHLSSYGHTRVLTPSFERLAAGGQLFRNAIAQSTTTTPSHASLLTSLYAQDHNVYSNFQALGSKARTLGEILKDNGYATFGLVNMRHLNPEVGNLSQGISHFIRSADVVRATDSIDYFFDWIDSIGERPFFAWLHLADVHTPYRPPAPYDRFYYDGDERDPGQKSLARILPFLPNHMSDHRFFKKWLEGITDLKWVFAQYQGAVTYVDDELGRFMVGLKERGLLKRTGLVVTSDHGENLGEHDMYFVHTGLYEQTIRVPLLTYFPGGGGQGTQINDVVELVDVLPTVLEYLDIEIPGGIRGRSLWPLIRGEQMPQKAAFVEHAGKNLVALRSRRYKYIKHLKTKRLQPNYPFVAGKEELYDLVVDPQESKNLVDIQKGVLSYFQNELRIRQKDKLALSAGESELSAETVDVLRSLGYIQ